MPSLPFVAALNLRYIQWCQGPFASQDRGHIRCTEMAGAAPAFEGSAADVGGEVHVVHPCQCGMDLGFLLEDVQSGAPELPAFERLHESLFIDHLPT